MSSVVGGVDPETISRRLREAEARRSDAERSHADAVSQLRSATSRLDTHSIQQLQSRVRELEKKASLETVRCEELQLELSTAMRARNAARSGTTSQSVTWAPMTTTSTSGQPASEIERIMAKIEQDNRILAELDHSRSTTHGLTGSSQGLEYHSPSHSPIPHSIGINHAIINQSSTMPTLSSIHGQQFTMSNSNSVGYSMNSTHNPSIYNPTVSHTNPTYSSITNPHQVTFNNPISSSLVNNISHMTSGLGMQSNLQGIGSNVPTLGIGTSLTGQLSSTMPTLQSGLTGIGVPTSLTGLTSTLGTFTSGLSNPLSGLTSTQLSGLSSSLTNPLVTGTYTNALLPSSLTNPMKMNRTTDDLDFNLTRYGISQSGQRVSTPVTPHQPSNWGLGLDSSYAADTLSLSHTQNRAMGRAMPSSGLELDVSGNYLNGGMMNEGQVDMLDIPGKGRCCVYIARFSYDPPESESAEGELNISAGDYLLVWGPPDPSASYLDAELLDGRRGLVPANFVQRLVGDDLLEFHQAVVSTLRDADETTAISDISMSRDVARLSEMADISDGPEDDDSVPAPRQLTLERQLNKSVLIGWTAPEGVQMANIDSYHVYVDGVLKTTVKATERTRALVEGVDSNRPHRISVRSVTTSRRTSRDAACTMVIGRDTATMGPTCVRASGVTCSQAVISWLPANSNHQHVVCVNNVEVRTVKPGVYKHIITGLAPSTQYRVTVRAKHLRAGPPPGAPIEEAPGAYTDFRTLPKGLPDPPLDIQLEAGPQDGTLLVTWQPVTRPPTSGPVTGYAVYADGKKVTDVDSPTGDHALIDISKLLSMNPRCVTVRTKSRDSQSGDSVPTAIPPTVLRNVAARMQRNQNYPQRGPPQGRPGAYSQQQQQQIIEHDENLSDKEIFPTGSRHDPQGVQQPSGFGTGLLKSIFDKITPSQSGIPAIEITKETSGSTADMLCSEDELDTESRQRRRQQQQPQQQQQMSQQPSSQQYQSTQVYPGTQQPPYPQQGQYASNQQYQTYQTPRNNQERGRTNPHQMGQQQNNYNSRTGQQMGPRGPAQQGPRMPGTQQQPQAQKRTRYFVALFDYDPQTMSPNPESCDEELPFNEGDTIKIWGDKDQDGFYWGECRGRRGFVPHNMVAEVEATDSATGGTAQGGKPRDRWSDAYANMPVKRMVALYDYDPQELSPNVDADVELSFHTGQIINVYGEMDDDGFYMAEIEGVRGLVPSNFLTEATDQYATSGQGAQGSSGMQRNPSTRGRGQGPGARGPPLPPRENVTSSRQPHRKTDACPTPLSQLDNTTASNPEQTNNSQVSRARGQTAGSSVTPPSLSSPAGTMQPAVSTPQQQQQQQQQQQHQQQQHQQQQHQQQIASPRRSGPSVVPQPVAPTIPSTQQAPGQPQANLMQKFSEMTAPGGDILSKGKELIFMKFGLGGK